MLWFLGLFCVLNAFQSILLEQTNLQISAPEFICDDDNIASSFKTDQTVIRLDGLSELNSSLAISIGFQNRGVQRTNVQQFNLKMWKLIRDLQANLEKTSPDIINENQIVLNNSLLIPGVRYNFNVTTVSSSGSSETSRFSIDYVDTLKETELIDEKIPISLVVKAPNSTYASANCFLSADVKACTSAASDYYLEWSITDETNATLPLEASRGHLLEIPPLTLSAPGTFIVRCDLKTSENDTLTSGISTLTVTSQGLSATVGFQYLVVSKNEQFLLEVDFMDLDNAPGLLNIEWNCTFVETGEPCMDFISENKTQLEVPLGFSSIGKYDITASISRGELIANVSCVVEITDTESLPVIVAPASLLLERVDPSKPLEVPIDVVNLESGCVLSWKGLQQGIEDCAYLDLTKLPGGIGDPKRITTLEDTFLDGMTDYRNRSVNRAYSLRLPAPGDSWSGLEGDTCYQFRITVLCMDRKDIEFDLDNSIDAVETVVNVNAAVNNDTDNATISASNDTLSASADDPIDLANTVYCDLIIRTNAPPVPSPLEVSPTEGEALKTVFTFRSEPAADKIIDYPLLYQFGYTSDNGTRMVVTKTYDPSEVRVTLPYSELPIIPFLEVCDAWRACATVQGNEINTLLPNITSEQTDATIEAIKRLLKHQEYADAFTVAAGALLTYKGMSEEAFSDVSKRIDAVTASEIERLLNNTSDVAVKRKSVSSLLAEVTKIGDYDVLSDSTLQALINIRDEIFERRSSMERQKRETLTEKKNVDSTTPETIKAFIEISELVILRANSSKIASEISKFKTKINNYLSRLCKNVESTPVKIVTKMVTIGFEKLNKKTVNEVFTIPFAGDPSEAKIRLGKDFVQLLNKNNDYCLGKFVYSRDYLPQRNSTTQERIYSVVLYDEQLRSDINIDRFKDYSVNIRIPALKYTNIRKDEEYQCRTLDKDDNWSEVDCILVSVSDSIQPKQVHCKCNRLGYFALFVTKNTKPTLRTTTTTTTTTTAIPKVKKTTTIKPVVTTRNVTLTTQIVKTTVKADNFTAVGRNASLVEKIRTLESGFDIIDVINIMLCVGIVSTLVASVVIWRRKNVNTVRHCPPPLQPDEIKYAHIYGKEMLN